MNTAQLDNLIHGYIDDRLTDPELAALNEALRRLPAARQRFWQIAALEGYLFDLADWRRGQEQATDLAMPEALQLFLEMEERAQAELQSLELPPEPIHLGGPGLFERAGALGQRVRPYGRRLARGLAVAAAIGLVLFLASEWTSSPPAERGPDGPVANVTPPIGPESPSDPAPQPILVATLDRVFDLPAAALVGNLVPGSRITEGQRLVLEHPGYVELTMASGARVVLQGPGTFVMAETNRIDMLSGRATASVPPQATGFTVQTPGMDIIDLGTEFGVSVDEHGHGEILVFDGLVEARQPAAKLEPGQQPMSLKIREGWGGKLEPDQVLPRSLQTVEQLDSLLYPRDWDAVTYRPRVSGEMRLLDQAPPRLADGDYLTFDPVLIPEARAVVLDRPLGVRLAGKRVPALLERNQAQSGGLSYGVPAGTAVNSFLIHFDKNPSLGPAIAERRFTITFPGEVLGILQSVNELTETDPLLGVAETEYPIQGNTMRSSVDPENLPTYDDFQVSADGRTLTVNLRVAGMDQVRVIVRNTDR